MKIPALFLILLTAAITTSTAIPPIPQAGNSYIEISGVRLRLGMTKAQVSEKLVGNTIKKIDEDFWGIGTEELAPEVIQFTNGRLTYAERDWRSNTNDIYEGLFGAVTTLNNQGFKRCHVETKTVASPGDSAKYIWIDCGEKAISVIRDTISGKSYNLVHETLGDYRDGR